jgi:WhiB family redox-sensing transcriptional regulator
MFATDPVEDHFEATDEATGAYPGLFERPSWHRYAACRGSDPRLFFPERGEPTGRAIAVCRRCPVRSECLMYAIGDGTKHGVWGGVAEAQRRHLRRAARIEREAG